jgi:hypothetical protein
VLVFAAGGHGVGGAAGHCRIHEVHVLIDCLGFHHVHGYDWMDSCCLFTPDPCTTKAHFEDEEHSRDGQEVHERYVADIDRVPVPEAPVDPAADLVHGIQMAEIRHQKTEQERLPDGEIRGSAQHQGLVDAEQQVQVRQLRQHDRGAQGKGPQGRRGGVRQLQIGGLEVVGIDGPDKGREGLDVQVEGAVRRRNGGRGRRLGHGNWSDGAVSGCADWATVRARKVTGVAGAARHWTDRRRPRQAGCASAFTCTPTARRSGASCGGAGGGGAVRRRGSAGSAASVNFRDGVWRPPGSPAVASQAWPA